MLDLRGNFGVLRDFAARKQNLTAVVSFERTRSLQYNGE